MDKSKLHYLSFIGSLDEISKLKPSKIDVNQTDQYGSTPLHLACWKNHTNLAIFLIKCDTDVNCKDKHLSTPLHWASYNGNTELVKYLINNKADIRIKDKNGIEPLHLAALRGHKTIVELLLKQQTPEKVKDNAGITPLHLATYCGHQDIVKILLKNGNFQIDETDNNSITPLLLACSSNHPNTVKFLIDNGANIYCTDIFGTQPIHWAAACGNMKILQWLTSKEMLSKLSDSNPYRPLFLATMYGHHEAIKFLLINGDCIKIESGDCDNYQKLTNLERIDDIVNKNYDELKNSLGALCWAASFCSKITVDRLIDTTLSYNKLSEQYNLLLHYAASFGNCEVILYLIRKGAEVNFVDMEENTPLQWAVGHGHIDAVKLLLAHGASKQQVLCWATTSANLDIIKLLFENNFMDIDEEDIYFHRTALHWAVIIGNLEIVKFLLNKGAQVNVYDDHENLPIHYAVAGNYIEIARQLIERGSELDQEGEIGLPLSLAIINGNLEIIEMLLNVLLATPLHLAALSGNVDIVKFLILDGAQINIPDVQGNLPLHYAIEANDTETVKLLLEYGSDVHSYGTLGRPLCKAAMYGNLAVVRMLLDVGVDINAGDEDEFGQKSPLMYAIKHGEKEIVNYLLEKGAKKTDLIHLIAQYGNVADLEDAVNLIGDVNALDDYGNTPIIYTCRNPENMKLLIRKGANVNYKTSYGKVPLHMAASLSLDAVKILIENGANINEKSDYGCTAITAAIRYDQKEIFAYLVEQSAKLDIINTAGMTLMHEIAQHDQTEMLPILLSKKVALNVKDNRGYTPLHIAIKHASVKLVKMLVDAGCEINVFSNDRKTPLSLAARYRDLRKAKLLILHGADINLDKDIVFDILYLDFIERINLYGPNTNVGQRILRDHISDQDIEIIKFLINAGLSLNNVYLLPSSLLDKLPKLQKYFSYLETHPLSLKQLGRIAGRKAFGKHYYAVMIDQCLPLLLKKYLLFDVIED